VSSAEAIARVVADLRADRIRTPPAGLRPDGDPEAFHAVARMMASDPDGPVVDATGIYQPLADHPQGVAVYEDHPCIAPPWPTAVLCYVNEHGNVMAMTLTTREFEPADRRQLWEPYDSIDPHGTRVDHTVDWSRVRWVTEVLVWVGGRSKAIGPVLTTGPMHMWRLAVYDDGVPADYRWIQLLPGYDQTKWDMAQLVVLGALNFLNCRNVELVEPVRPRAEARALARAGVRVSEINVFPVGRSSRSGPARTHGVPLTSVRGHFARYGPAYDRGLLFGRYEGRFWIPQHARGDREHGEIDQRVTLHPEG
jgi:hypothetical protein